MKPQLMIDRRAELGEVRDQGPFPTCLAHATSTVHRNVRGLDEPLSAEALHYHATGADWSSGSTMNELQHALRKEGQPQDCHCEPLPDEKPDNWSPPTNVPVYQSESNQEPALPTVVKDTILASDLPVLGISLPEGFFDPTPPWVISAGRPVARHAVTGIGLAEYEDGTAILIRNSWGEDWADSGHAWLDEKFLKAHLKAVLVLTRGGNT